MLAPVVNSALPFVSGLWLVPVDVYRRGISARAG